MLPVAITPNLAIMLCVFLLAAAVVVVVVFAVGLKS